jgi:HEAT repeat protein
MPEPIPPSALLYITAGCAHCPAVLEGLSRLVKEGRLARLEVVNLSADPKAAARAGIRAVPWTRIGPFELEGSLSPSELAYWTQAATDGAGWTAYYSHLLETSRLAEVIARVREKPATLGDLLGLLASEDTTLTTRIGIGAVVEELQGSDVLRAAIPQLEQLALSALPAARADACYYLGLTGDPRVLPAVRRLLDDEEAQVREIALETLALLGETEGYGKGDDDDA